MQTITNVCIIVEMNRNYRMTRQLYASSYFIVEKRRESKMKENRVWSEDGQDKVERRVLVRFVAVIQSKDSTILFPLSLSCPPDLKLKYTMFYLLAIQKRIQTYSLLFT